MPIADDGTDDVFGPSVNNGELASLPSELIDASTDVPRTGAWWRCRSFLQEALKCDSSRVLVHCALGVNRSATIVIAWLMETQDLPAQRATQIVKSRRYIINPIYSYRSQLEKFQISNLGMPLSAEESPDATRGQSLSADFPHSCCPSFMWKERLIGYTGFLAFGLLAEVVSFHKFYSLSNRGSGKFVAVYAMGNIVAFASTFFVAGLLRQFNKMREHCKWISFAIYLTFMIVVVVVSFVEVASKDAIIVSMSVVKWIALVWYTSCYVPLSQRMARRIRTNIFSRSDGG